jgi:hypothetical protein
MDGVARLMDFTNDFAVDQRHKQEAIVMSFQLNQIQQRERNGELEAARSIEIMTNQARQILDLLSSVLQASGQAAVQ